MVRTLDPTRSSLKAEQLANKFALRVVGQTEATQALIRILQKFQSGLYDRSKPIGKLLFLGPTGSGKTRVAEAFTEGLFGSVDKMMVVDCAEFQHSHDIAKLVGSPPGYLGHRETHPFFTNKSIIEARSDAAGKEILPFTVILFDEIEKASDSLWALLLGVLDKGRLMTGTNEQVTEMKNTIILMTSNVGAAELQDDGAIGFDTGNKGMSDAQMQRVAMAAAKRKFMPEFLNRLDQIVVFKTLTPENIQEILRLELDALWDRVVTQATFPFDFNVSPSAFRELLKLGYDSHDNARYMKRAVERHVADPIGRLTATGQILPGDTIVVDFDGEWKYYAQARDSAKGAAGGI